MTSWKTTLFGLLAGIGGGITGADLLSATCSSAFRTGRRASSIADADEAKSTVTSATANDDLDLNHLIESELLRTSFSGSVTQGISIDIFIIIYIFIIYLLYYSTIIIFSVFKKFLVQLTIFNRISKIFYCRN